MGLHPRRALHWATRRRTAHRWGRRLIWGYRSGEWWIGVRRNFEADVIEWNLLGFSLFVGRE